MFRKQTVRLAFGSAAIVALLVAIGAGYVLLNTYYQDRVELKFEKESLACTQCTTAKKAAEANWQQVQSKVKVLRSQRKYREADAIERAHAGERPANVDVPCEECGLPGPDYNTPALVLSIAAIVSFALFASLKAKT